MKSIFSGAGYFMNDDRASGGKLAEDDTLGCTHCHAAMKKQTWIAGGGWKCTVCDKPLCPTCGAAPPQLKCVGPLELQLERAITENYRREQNAKVLGI